MTVAKKKKIIFDDTDVRHAQLKLRLQHDGLTQAEFFRSFVSGYLNKDSDVINYIKKYKTNNSKQSKKNIKRVDDDISKGRDLLSQFGIESEELENIFDIIAEQHPDL